MDDLKSSHINPKVSDKFLQWIKDMFKQHRDVKTTQGPLHDYLGMTLDSSVPGRVGGMVKNCLAWGMQSKGHDGMSI